MLTSKLICTFLLQLASGSSSGLGATYSSANANLTKIAEAAGKKMRKLRRNWSLKKSDITRSLSKIKSRHSR